MLSTTSTRNLAQASTTLSKFCRGLSTKSNVFLHPERVEFLAAAPVAESIPPSTGLPEVLVTGRANVGKSTLLNALMGRTDMVRVSKKAGHTKSLNFFRLGSEPEQLVLVDSPGYGMRGRREFSGVFDEYLKHRAQLRRVFILINAQHGILDSDRAMIEHISEAFAQRESPFSLQPVITKIDSLAAKGNAKRTLSNIRQDIAALQLTQGGNPQPAILDPILTASTTSPPFGIEQLRASVQEACTTAYS